VVYQIGFFTDIVDCKQEQLNIFPNPANNYIFIENLAKNEAKYLLTLKNIQGQDIYIEQINFLNKFELDVSALAEGIYYLILQNENEQIVNKVIKIK
jgi:hypothetical protein